MRNNFLALFLASFFLALPMTAQAAYVGSMLNAPLDVMEENRMVIAGEANIVSGRDLETKAGVTNKIDGSNQIGLKAEYGLTEGVGLFFKVGTADWTFQSGSPLSIEYDNNLYYGAGMKYVYRSETNFMLAGDFQYLWQPKAEAGDVTSGSTAATNIKGLDAEIRELQVSVLFGYKVDLSTDTSIVPYAGIALNSFDFKIDSGSFDAPGAVSRAAQSYGGDDMLGFIVGTSLQTGTSFNINLEGRFVAEEAFSIGINYRF